MKTEEKNKKVKLVEDTFGIKLPKFKLYASKIRIEAEAKEERGVLYASKWKFENGPYIPADLERFFPKEGMDPEQALKQLDECSSIARGYVNDSYRIYNQNVLVQFLENAILNCMYLASKDFKSWNQIRHSGTSKTYLDAITHEIFVLHDAFSRQNTNYCEDYMSRTYLRLLLENNAKLFKGNLNNLNELVGNTIYRSLFPLSLNKIENEDAQKYLRQILNQKCNEVFVQLHEID